MTELDWDAYIDENQMTFVRDVAVDENKSHGERKKVQGVGGQTTLAFYPVLGINQIDLVELDEAKYGIPPFEARIVGKLVNEGGRADAAFGLEAKSVYYLIAERGAGDELVSRIVKRSGGVLVWNMRLYTCHPNERPYSQGRFSSPENCTRTIEVRGAPTTNWLGIGWFTCAQGCCASGGVVGVTIPGRARTRSPRGK